MQAYEELKQRVAEIEADINKLPERAFANKCS
jgi:hypothetical protein